MLLHKTLLKFTSIAIVAMLGAPVLAESDQPIPVVATFSILGDMVKRIGVEHISLTTLVGPNGNTHVYQPTPADARAVSNAKVLIVNGLEFEGWLERLVDASDFKGKRVVATKGIEPMAFEEEAHYDDKNKGERQGDDKGHHDHHHHGAFDPHIWHSLGAALTYVDNITAALAIADPAHASDFYQNRAAYVTEIKALDAEIRQILASLPTHRRTVVTSHDAFQYFAREYGLKFLAPQGLSTESEASAKEVSHLIKQIRQEGIPAVFIENITNPRLLKQIANETGVTIGGTLYPGALSDQDGPASTYLDMMRHNATTLAQALSHE